MIISPPAGMCLNVGDRKAGRAKVDQRGDIVEPAGPEGARKRSRHQLIATQRLTEPHHSRPARGPSQSREPIRQSVRRWKQNRQPPESAVLPHPLALFFNSLGMARWAETANAGKPASRVAAVRMFFDGVLNVSLLTHRDKERTA